jgi:hypothetical protein
MPQRPRTRPPSASATRPDDPPATSIPLPSEIGGQLLYDRDQARRLLRVSKSSLRRMERRGLLRPIRPTGSPVGKVTYSGANLIELAHGGDDVR